MTINRCAITGFKLDPHELKPLTGTTIEYETKVVGKVKITIPAYTELLEGDFERYLIAGICKYRTLRNEEPVLIDTSFIREDYKKLNPPIDFEEKTICFLKYLYQNGGKENKSFDLNSQVNFSLAFSSPEEFIRIVNQLKDDNLITYNFANKTIAREGFMFYGGIKVTSTGREEAKKNLPKLPMFGLISQEITTGNQDIDEKINHARELFFDNNPSIDKMRSACETLSYVLEPLREDLKSYFAQKDVSDFFQIVNNFDIRHNKDMTKNLVHKEQLEWVFYTLLNTVNTYVKLTQSGK